MKIKSNIDESLLDTIRGYKDKAPLIISESSWKHKEKHINKVKYLKESLGKLSTMEGNLVIYGSSLAQNDEHIWSKVRENEKIEKVFISIKKGYEDKVNVDSLAGKEVILYNAESLGCWIYPEARE